MAVTNLKIQLEFRMGADGWSEIYYHAGTVPGDFAATASALVVARKKILVGVASIHHVRISVAQPGGRSYRFPVVNAAGELLPGLQRDVGGVTTVIGVYAGNVASRLLKLHGTPDDLVTYDAQGNPNVTLPVRTSVFLDHLVNSQYQIKHITIPANDPNNQPITDISVINGNVSFAFNGVAAVVGGKIIVSGCKGSKVTQFNRLWTVKNLIAAPGSGVICQTAGYIDPLFQYVGSSGRIRNGGPTEYSFLPITTYDNFVGFSTRKTGRPTDEHRGRRSGKR